MSQSKAKIDLKEGKIELQGSEDFVTKHLEKIIDLVSLYNNKTEDSSNQNLILWTDDRPENNIYERKAFEAVGFKFNLALNTEEAIKLLQSNSYVAIISDMGRKEGKEEGYVLLDKVRKMGLKTPFFIYAGSNKEEHKKMIVERGGQGTTNIAEELLRMVTGTIS